MSEKFITFAELVLLSLYIFQFLNDKIHNYGFFEGFSSFAGPEIFLGYKIDLDFSYSRP